MPTLKINQTGTNKKQIVLHLVNNQWMSYHKDPDVFYLFGTNEIPTPFFYPMTGEDVKSRIQYLNPDKEIIVITNK